MSKYMHFKTCFIQTVVAFLLLFMMSITSKAGEEPGFVQAEAGSLEAKQGERHLIDYIGKDVSVLAKDFGEQDGAYGENKDVYYKDMGLEFSSQDPAGPPVILTAICHGSHYPVIDKLYGDSAMADYLDYFEKEGFSPEPEANSPDDPREKNVYIDKNLHLLFQLEGEDKNEPPRRIKITEVDSSIYSASWQTFYVQQVLGWLGYDPGAADSQGQKIAEAILSFQEDHWLDPDGVMDRSFCSVLNSYWNHICRYHHNEPWYLAYETQLQLWWSDRGPEDERYALIYVDEDDIPELARMGRTSAQGSHILTWHDGKLDVLWLAAVYPVYVHKGNILLDNDAQIGDFLNRFYEVRDGKWSRLPSGEYTRDDAASLLEWASDPNAKGVYSYTWEGKKVSEEEYYKKLKGYIPMDGAREPSLFYDAHGIVDVLWAGGPRELDYGLYLALSWYQKGNGKTKKSPQKGAALESGTAKEGSGNAGNAEKAQNAGNAGNTGNAVQGSRDAKAPFYGIWCSAAKDYSEAENYASRMRAAGYNAQVFMTTDWSNLNSVPWYVVSAGVYHTEGEAARDLPYVQGYCPDAYVKYSGNYQK